MTKSLTAVLVFCILSGCTRTPKPASARLTVAASVLPIWTITKHVTQGIPGLEVKLLLPPNLGSPHDFSITVPQAALLEKADVLVMNGLGLERFLEKSPALQRPDLHLIRAAATVDTMGMPSAPELETAPHSEESGSYSVNPHAWVSPRQEIVMTRYLAEQFGKIDPQFAPQYRINADRYIARLDSLDFRFKGLIQQAPNRRVVAFHRAFDYLARDYGLEIVAVIENDPGVEPSARDLAALARQIKAAAPVAIFAEPQYPARVAQTLSTETGVPLYVLNPLETGPADPDAYINAMWENLKTLGTALLLNRKE